MSQSIDNRIVNMVFNNQQFEEGVAESTASLDNLKKSLDFSKSNIDLSKITSGIEGLSNRFTSIFGQLKAKFIDSFVGDIVNQSKRLINQALIDPIKDGLNEYELKMGSVQTILNSAFNRKGDAVTLEEVNYQLEELNKYADRTIYSFKDMTANIGKFTNAGVALEDAVAAIQGVSNVAAVSGANANEASRAMYNFAQALSSGYVKLIDWKSIENANMATVEFKNQLLESAVAAGTLEKTADGMYRVLSGGGFKEKGVETLISATNHFNDSLSSAWMTTEVLTATLSKYSDETTEIGRKAFAAATEVKTLSQAWDTLKESAGSSWAQTWEIIFGDLNQSKKLWTRLEQDLEQIFVKGSEKRNELLKTWADMGGREHLFSTDKDNLGALFNLLDAVKKIIRAVKEAFTDVFGEANAFRLFKITGAFQEFTKSLVLNGDSFRKFKEVVKGVLSVFALLKDIFVALVKPIRSFFDALYDMEGNHVFLTMTSSIGKTLTYLRESILDSKVLDKITAAFEVFYKALGVLVSGIAETIRHIAGIFRGNLMDVRQFVLAGFGEPVTMLQKISASLFSILKRTSASIAAFFATLLGKDPTEAWVSVSKFFDKIGLAVVNFYRNLKNLRITKAMADFWDSLKGPGGSFLDGVISFWQNIKTYITGLVEQIHPLQILKNLFSGIFDVLKAIVHGVGPAIANLGDFAVKVIGGLIDGAGKLIKIFGQSLKDGTLGSLITGGVNIGMGVGIFKAFSSFGDFAKTITGAFEDKGVVSKFLNSVSGSLSAFQKKINDKALKNTAISIGILVASIVLLASIDTAKMAIATGAIVALMGELTAVMTTMAPLQASKSLSTIGTTLIKMGAAILVLSTALKVISSVDPERLGASLLALTVLLGELTAVVKILGSGKNLNSLKQVGKGLLSLSAALLVLALAVKAFGKMEARELEQGLSTVTILLGELTLFAKIAGNTKKMASVGAGLLLVSTAMLEFAAAVKIFGKLGDKSWVKGMSAFTIVLSEIVLSMMIFDMLNAGKVAAASASMILIATAMLEVSGVLAVLSTIKLEKLASAIVAFSVVLLEMVGALWALSGINPLSLIASAGAMVIMGAALLEMSVALKVLSTMSLGETLIALVALAGTLAILGAAAILLGPVAPAMYAVAGAFALFGVAALALGAGLTLISVGLASFAGSVVVSMASLLEAIKIGIRALPEILATLASSLGLSISSIVSLITTILKSLLEAIRATVPDLVSVVLEVIKKVLAAVAKNIEPIVVSLIEIVVGIIKGLTKGIPEILSAAVDLFKGVFDSLVSIIKDMGAAELVTAILGSVGMIAALTVVMAEIAAFTAVALVATLSLPTIGKNLSAFMDNIQPFLNGIKNVGSEALDGAKILAEAILALTVSSIIDGITRWITGKSSFESFGKELAAFGPHLKSYNDSIKGINNTNITASAEAVKTMAEMANELPNSGGIVSWFKGDNTLADFGKMLADFGPQFAKYAQSVNGINPTAVGASATAATALAQMASNLPNSGGLISWITGDNTLADFGRTLASFGPHLKTYSDSVVGVNVTSIASSVSATTYLVSVAKAIDAVKLSGDAGPITHFGAQITKLGNGIYAYAQFVTAINWDVFARSVIEINKLADLSDRVALLDTSELSKFANNISKMATNGIKQLITAFRNSYATVQNAAATLAQRAVTGANSMTPQFTTIGINMLTGMINGLHSRAQAVYNVAQGIANQAAAIVRRSLQIHSPSRVFEEIGMYVDLGFAQGLTKYATTIEASADSIGRSAMDAMAESIQTAIDNIDDNPEFSPTISPVLDLTNVNDGLRRLGDSMNANPLRATGYYKTSMDLAGMVMETNRNNQNGGAILNTMMQMMDEFSNLSAAVENMQIVMDSGVVVGAIAPKMDAALGRRVVYKGRGN